MAEQLNVGDVVATLRGVTTDFQRAMADASQRLQQLGQQAQQTQQQFAALSFPFQAITNAMTRLSDVTFAAIKNQTALSASLASTQAAVSQFGATATRSTAALSTAMAQVQQFGAATAQSLATFTAAMTQAQTAMQGLGSTAASSQSSLGNWGSTLQTALGVAGGIGLATSLSGIVRALKDLVTESLSLAAKSQDLHLAFRAIEGSAGAANRTLTFLFDTSQRLGIDFLLVADGFKRMDQAAKGTVLEGEGIARVFANIVSGARTLGVTSEQTAGAIVALEQILSKGKLTAEEYRKQLANAIPGALQLMSSGLGITLQAMEAFILLGIIPGETAVIAFGNAMGALRGKSGVDTIEQLSSTFKQLKNETTAWLTAMGEGAASIIQPFIKDVIRLSGEVRTLFGIRPPGVQGMPGASTQGFGPLIPGTLGMPAPGTTGPDERHRASVTEQALEFAHSQFDALIQREAARVGEDATIMSRLFQAESSFKPRNVGPPVYQGPAQGLGGIMPRTGAPYGLQTPADFFDPEKNVAVSSNIMRDYRKIIRDKFGVLADETRITLAAYNAGIGQVVGVIEETQRIGETVTYAQVLGRLKHPEQTGPYVERIAGPLVAGPGQAAQATAMGTLLAPAGPAPPGGVGTGTQDPFAPMVKKATEVVETLTAAKKTLDAIGISGFNVGNVLGTQLDTQVDEAIKKFGIVGTMLAAFPQAYAAMLPAQREVVAQAAKMAAAFGEEGKVRDILKAQAEALEQLTIRRRADLVVLEQGQAAGERFLRAETQALAVRRTHEEATRVVGTGTQEIARYQAQIAILATQADALGREVEGRTRDPERLAQAMATGRAYHDALDAEIKKEDDAFAALQKLAAQYTTTKEARDTDTASILANTLATSQYADQVPALVKAIQDSAKVLATVPQREAEAAASRSSLQVLQRLRDRAEQLQTPQQQTVFDILTGTPSRADLKQRQKDDRLLLTPEAKAEAETLRAAIAGQERLNYLLGVSDQLASTAAQSWVTGLQGIIAGTQSVAQAFKAMVASVLQSLGQIAAQESFRALFRLGVGLVAGSITGPSPSPGLAPGWSGGGTPPPLMFASGGMVTKPTRILAGESAATNPEWIVNHPQMQSLLAAAVQRAPSAGGQALGGNVTVINVATPQQAEAEAAKARARGDEVILNTIMRDVQRGEASQLVRTLRTLQL